MARKDSCPSCFTKKFRRNRRYVPAYPDDQDDPEKKDVVHGVIFYICRRCGWEGGLEDLVSTRKFSVKRMGKFMSRVGRMRY